jgi:Sugar-specific transcriptional regulator TrmB.
MSTLAKSMTNEGYEPTANDEAILRVLKNGRDDGQPWGRANPRLLIDQTGLSKSSVEFSLRSLSDAGWIERITRGQYELVADPREERR